MEVLDSLGAMMATTKKCESIQAAVIMPNKKEVKKLKEEQKRTDQIESTQKLQ
jgi:hypothetical protein